jgi:hypothetical protein
MHLSLAAAIAVLVVGAGIGAIVLRDGPADKASTTVAKAGEGSDASDPTTVDPGKPAAAGGSNTTATTSSGSSTKAAASTRTWHNPAPGTYRYHHRRTGAGAADYDGTFVIAAVTARGYTEMREQDSVKANRYYSIERTGLRQTKFTLNTGSGTQTCGWDNPITVLPNDLADGHEWTSKSACTFAIGQDQATTQLESTWKVIGVRDSKVGDTTIPVLRVDGKATARTTTEAGTIVRSSTVVEYYDLARGLLAQSTENATETGPSGKTSYRIVETMLTTQPEVPKQ